MADLKKTYGFLFSKENALFLEIHIIHGNFEKQVIAVINSLKTRTRIVQFLNGAPLSQI